MLLEIPTCTKANVHRNILGARELALGVPYSLCLHVRLVFTVNVFLSGGHLVLSITLNMVNYKFVCYV